MMDQEMTNADAVCETPNRNSLEPVHSEQQTLSGPSISTSEIPCGWSSCTAKFESKDQLLPHLSNIHLSANHLKIRVPMSSEPLGNTNGAIQEIGTSVNTVQTTPDQSSIQDGNNISGTVQATGNSAIACKWNDCSLSSCSDVNQLLQHVVTSHVVDSQLPHSCCWKDCFLHFQTFEDLTDHVSNSHVGFGAATYICEWKGCPREQRPFNQRQKIMRHIQTHTGDKPFECAVCHQRFSDHVAMNQHRRLHSGEKPFACPTEGCEKQFTVPSSLNTHLRTHTGEKPFVCNTDGCEKRFSDSSNLTKHIRVHTGEKPFKCPINMCERKFARADQASRHLKVHRGSSGSQGNTR